MKNRDLFPQGYATGDAFCNRISERKDLAHYMHHSQHVVVMAPRRYGKSSLIQQVLLDTKLIGTRIDLLPATNIYFVTKAVKKSFYEVAETILPKTEKAKLNLIKFIKTLHPKLKLGMFGQSIELALSDTPENSISEMLLGLDAIATKVNKKVVICFDEFQQISEFKNHHTIEASIRHAVEASQNISYIFSGSSRHLLSQMFNSKSRPLYRLCDLMEIDRIHFDSYFPILLKRFHQRWTKDISEAVINEVLSSTACHPFYVNSLCRLLWREDKIPTVASVQKQWQQYVLSQQKWIRDDLVRLTPNQRNIIAVLAFFPTNEPYAKDFVEKVRMSGSSLQAAMQKLLKLDMVHQSVGQYKVLDPAMAEYMRQIESFDFIEG
ncbi:MAG: ATP-binding protein [Coxiellaceae bacterium]|nr:ATP-binding protein [Coxiellaceae bacterium]